jgi:NADH-quinone oxidoreductase subunit A
MHFDYLNVLVFSSVGFLFVFANLAVASIVRPKRKGQQGLEVYECGEETVGDAWIKFDIRYYTVALVYIVFAVEIAFLFPWAIVLVDTFQGTGAAEGKDLGVSGLIAGAIFIVVLFLGLAYDWAKGDLNWIMNYEPKRFEPTAARPRSKVPTIAELETALAAAQATAAPVTEEEEAA